ncbi:hypothetical protein ASG90_18755 [Nocardioides sp. Soil797]|nr:hypothetical protein ASG90_18755 [Nocardioides sp. Soil797]
MKIKQLLTAGIVVLAMGSTLAACSDDGDDKKSSNDSSVTTNNNDDTAPADDAPADEGGDTDVSTGGDTSVSVEGKDLAGLDLDSVTCVKQGGKITVASGAVGGQEGLGVVMTDEDQPKVESLSMLVDGVALAVSSMAGAELGSAEVTVDGDTYTITGEATGGDTKDPTAGMVTKKFEISVSCS